MSPGFPFFRNAINEGLPVVELAYGTDAIKKGDTVGIDFERGVVIHEGREYHFPALPEEVLATLDDGGLISHVKKLLGKAWGNSHRVASFKRRDAATQLHAPC